MLAEIRATCRPLLHQLACLCLFSSLPARDYSLARRSACHAAISFSASAASLAILSLLISAILHQESPCSSLRCPCPPSPAVSPSKLDPPLTCTAVYCRKSLQLPPSLPAAARLAPASDAGPPAAVIFQHPAPPRLMLPYSSPYHPQIDMALCRLFGSSSR
jgi:hypothetical protein